MTRRLHLESELQKERESMQLLEEEVHRLQERLKQGEMMRMSNCRNRKQALERDVEQLQQSCEKMAHEVTQLTGGKGGRC